MKSEQTKIFIRRQLKRYAQAKINVAQMPALKIKIPQVIVNSPSSELQEIRKEVEQEIASNHSGIYNKGYRHFGTIEGTKFKKIPLNLHVERIGKKCIFAMCERLTENQPQLCYKHSTAVSKSKKYKVANAKQKPQILPSLEEFKDKLSKKP